MIRSIRGRLLGLAAVWIVAALLAAFLAIAGLLERFVTGRFDAETGAVADGLIAALQVEDTAGARLALSARPADPRFALPLSGWYWQVTVDGAAVARSPSLLDGRLTGPRSEATGAPGRGADGAALRVTRREVTIPDSDAPILVTVTAPAAQIDDSLRLIVRPLALALAVLGAGLIGASVIQVTAGLRSLDRLRRDLTEVRAGRAERLALPDVTELRPLVVEINAALDQNAALLARSRQHLGNLAHSLKTPLSALSNELPPHHPGQGLITRMDRLIGWHLRRARQAAPHVLGQHTPLRPVIEDILLVLRWPLADRGLTTRIDCPGGLTFAGERQDLEEMIGNLTENAAKWARARVAIRARSRPAGIELRIEDDGPGLSADQAPRALIRGARLDENGPPGAGLGLAIVADLATLHGGTLRLGRSDLGGLAAILDLPA